MRADLRRMELNLLDERALSYLHAVKVATYRQLQRDVYQGYHLKSVCNRIYRLEDNNLVRGSTSRSIANGARIVSLTSKGFRGFVASGEDSRIELRSDSIDHDLVLVDLRHKIMKLQKVQSYYTENQIQTWGRNGFDFQLADYVNLNSDSLIKIQLGQREIILPLEYESTRKTSVRYKDLLRKYYAHSGVILVFFLATDDAILMQVKKEEEAFVKEGKPRFLYSLIQSDLQPDALTLENLGGSRLVLATS